MYPTIMDGQGIYLYDQDGNEYIDGSSGAVTASIGHGVDEIIKEMTKQAEKISFVYRSQFTNEPAEELAQKLSQLSPGDLNWSFFVNSGSEATETAFKIAIQYWQERGIYTKTKVISRWMSYHGITLGALSMSGHHARRKRFTPLLEESPIVSPPYCYHCPLKRTFPDCGLLCAQELEQVIRRIGSEQIAAFIAEPIIGAAGGAITAPDGYYAEIKDICERNDILFIADEVMTGFGRTGKMFAIDHWGVAPDILAIGKGMGAGYTPIAATLVSDRIIEEILTGSKSIMSGHTYSANPQSAAIALAVLKYIERNNLITHANEVGTYLMSEVKRLATTHSIIGDVRGKGLLIGIEFICPYSGQRHDGNHVTEYIVETAMKQGLLLYPAAAGSEGIDGSAVLLAPPLTITKTEVDLLVKRLEMTVVIVQRWMHKKGIV
ncbi:aspartate aminotransferase family protein [Desertibacillus haloalkaliphilus]|uniref:aspartate aminotransferase family protein n=1 Tax=Desertibacillus haloalkaliphilus TaxID=1328930 RepID=UPI001C27D976|nr:aspartate aminotransferase family protein [Desertibacillus haloalkaliphilus]